MGGHEKCVNAIEHELEETRKRWDQDINIIGRILRAHLFVEYYLTKCLESTNPKLGSMENARLSFLQKVNLIDNTNLLILDLIQGIKHLNKIRNRIAHNLSIFLTQEDASIFLSSQYFKEMRNEIAKSEKLGDPSNDPIIVLEEFSLFVGSSLVLTPLGKAFGTALEELTKKEEKE